jgi:hypothetical protein
MDCIVMAAFSLYLNSGMVNPKILCDAAAYGLEQDAGDCGIASIHLYVASKHDQTRFHGPNVQIVNIFDAGHRFDRGRHM